MRRLIVALCAAVIVQAASAADLNALILEQLKKMPSGGKYSVSHFAKIKLQSAAHFESGKFFVIPKAPYPSFCSGATYIVFIKAFGVAGMPTVRARPAFSTNSPSGATSPISPRHSQAIL